jgi:hypothetical protein
MVRKSVSARDATVAASRQRGVRPRGYVGCYNSTAACPELQIKLSRTKKRYRDGLGFAFRHPGSVPGRVG